MREDSNEQTRFTGQPSGHNFFGMSSVPQKEIDEDLKIIKAFAKEHKLVFKEKRNQPPTIHIPSDFFTYRVYNEKVKRAVLGSEITYSIFYTTWMHPISVKKNWNGFESKKDPENKEETLLRMELAVEIEKSELQLKNIKQIELGRFKHIEEALQKITEDLSINENL